MQERVELTRGLVARDRGVSSAVSRMARFCARVAPKPRRACIALTACTVVFLAADNAGAVALLARHLAIVGQIEQRGRGSVPPTFAREAPTLITCCLVAYRQSSTVPTVAGAAAIILKIALLAL